MAPTYRSLIQPADSVRVAAAFPGSDCVVTRWTTMSSETLLPTMASTCDPPVSTTPRNWPGLVATSAFVVAP